jgi:hypothetical protein
VTADVRSWLRRLDETHQKATPGPWTPATAPSEDSDETHAEYLTGALRPDEGRPLWVAWAPVVEGLHDDSDYVVPIVTGDGPASEANAVFVAEAHRSLPALVAALTAVLDLADELEAASDLPTTHGEFDRGVAAHQRDAAERLRAAVAAPLAGHDNEEGGR